MYVHRWRYTRVANAATSLRRRRRRLPPLAHLPHPLCAPWTVLDPGQLVPWRVRSHLIVCGRKPPQEKVKVLHAQSRVTVHRATTIALKLQSAPTTTPALQCFLAKRTHANRFNKLARVLRLRSLSYVGARVRTSLLRLAVRTTMLDYRPSPSTHADKLLLAAHVIR